MKGMKLFKNEKKNFPGQSGILLRRRSCRQVLVPLHTWNHCHDHNGNHRHGNHRHDHHDAHHYLKIMIKFGYPSETGAAPKPPEEEWCPPWVGDLL